VVLFARQVVYERNGCMKEIAPERACVCESAFMCLFVCAVCMHVCMYQSVTQSIDAYMHVARLLLHFLVHHIYASCLACMHV